ARGELISRAKDGFRRVTALVLDQVISRGRAETVRGEEFLGPQPVVLLYRAPHVSIGHAVPSHHVFTPPRIILARGGPGRGWRPVVWSGQRLAAVDVQRLAGQEPVGQGEQDTLGDLLGGADPPG